MSDFITELEEDIREEKLLSLWKKYGNYIIGIALAIVISTAGYALWSYFKKHTQLKHYASFSQALTLVKDGKKEEALKIFQQLGKNADGYSKLAQLYEATLISQPTPLYHNIDQENLQNPALGTLAKFLGALSSLNAPETEPILESLSAPRNAWAPLSLELLALMALKKGNASQATEYCKRGLAESFLTPYEDQRLRMMLAQLEDSPILKGSLGK